MKRSLLLVLGAAMMLVAVPAFGQYVFFDTNGDQVCDATDVLDPSVTSIDIYYDTTHNGDGTAVSCPDGTTPLDFLGYEIILHTTGSGSVAFGSYTNNLTGASILPGSPASGGGDYYTSWVTFTPASPGLNLAGTLNITVSGPGTPVLSPATSTSLNALFNTSFASNCPTTGFENAWILDRDFFDACGTASPTPIRSTTWGQIKNLYK